MAHIPSFKNPQKILSYIFHHRSLDTIEPGVLTVSCYANFFPVCYKKNVSKKPTNARKIVGLDVDIMKQFCKLTKLKLKLIEKESFDGIWFDPIIGKSDIAIGGIGISKDRSTKETSWTIPYFYVFRTLIYNRKNRIRNLKEISGIVRATPGSTGYIDGKMRLEAIKRGHFLEAGKTDEEDIQDLLDGKIQGLFRGSFVGKAIIEKHPKLGMIKPWKIDDELIATDGEVFAYPTRCSSGISLLMSCLVTEDIFTEELSKLLEKYKLI